jgi:hypothetical protein
MVLSILDDDSKPIPDREWHEFVAKLAAIDTDQGQEVT